MFVALRGPSTFGSSLASLQLLYPATYTFPDIPAAPTIQTRVLKPALPADFIGTASNNMSSPGRTTWAIHYLDHVHYPVHARETSHQATASSPLVTKILYLFPSSTLIFRYPDVPTFSHPFVSSFLEHVCWYIFTRPLVNRKGGFQEWFSTHYCIGFADTVLSLLL